MVLTNAVRSLLQGSTPEQPVHWTTLITTFVTTGLCNETELIAAMNQLLMPHEQFSGINHQYWSGLPPEGRVR